MRRRFEDRLGDCRHRADHVFATVEHNQRMLVAEPSGQSRYRSTPGSEIPNTVLMVLATRSESGTEASPTNQTPSSYDALTFSATATATVVLPIPPGPTTVRKRCRVSCDPSAVMTSSRPTMRVSGPGRLPPTTALSDGAVAGCNRSRATDATKL